MAARRRGLAFSLGGMGTASANFYHDAYARQGWSEIAVVFQSAMHARS